MGPFSADPMNGKRETIPLPTNMNITLRVVIRIYLTRELPRSRYGAGQAHFYYT